MLFRNEGVPAAQLVKYIPFMADGGAM